MNYSQKKIRDMIMSHYKNPLFKKDLKDPHVSFYTKICADELHFDWVFENDVLKSVGWDGDGCAVFQAATDIFFEIALNKTKNQIKTLSNNLIKMVDSIGTEMSDDLEKLAIFKEMQNSFGRGRCAKMVAEGVLQNIDSF